MHPDQVSDADGEYRIYSPSLAQAVALAQFLRRAFPHAHLCGVTMPGDQPLRSLIGVYDSLVEETALPHKPAAVTIPTGAGSTDHLISRGDVTLGDITLTSGSLRFSDKAWSLEVAAAAGVPIPVTWSRAEDVEVWPVFFKSARESEDRRRGLADSLKRLPPDRHGLIFQEVITGKGTFGVGFLARDGEVLVSHTHFERESFPPLGGSAAILERIDSARLEGLTRALVEAATYSGWGLAEFKYCPRRDDYVFMEINAKFWASWEMALLNEPAFARCLFGADSANGGVREMVILDLALRRGPMFWPKILAAAARGAHVKAYPGWPRQLAASLVPRSLFPLVKRLIKSQV